jgi:hypothetical protein
VARPFVQMLRQELNRINADSVINQRADGCDLTITAPAGRVWNHNGQPAFVLSGTAVTAAERDMLAAGLYFAVLEGTRPA